MSNANSNAAAHSGKTQKPNKPYPDVPLSAHAPEVWMKKIHGKMHSFAWDHPDETLAKYFQHDGCAALLAEASAGPDAYPNKSCATGS